MDMSDVWEFIKELVVPIAAILELPLSIFVWVLLILAVGQSLALKTSLIDSEMLRGAVDCAVLAILCKVEVLLFEHDRKKKEAEL